MTIPLPLQASSLRRALLSYERNTSPTLSPDGRSIALVKTDDDGQEIWLREDDGRERPLARHPGEMIKDIRWASDGSTVFYRHAPRGRERWSLAGVRAAGLGHLAFLAPGPVSEYWLSESEPAAVAYSSRRPGARYPDLFRETLTDVTSEPALIAANPGFHRWLVDGTLRVRGGIRLFTDGRAEIDVGDSLETARTVLAVGVDTLPDLAIQRFSADGDRLYALVGSEQGRRRLVAIETRSGEVSTIFEHTALDIGSYPIAGDGVWFDPATGQPDIAAVMGQRLCYHPLADTQREAVVRLAASADALVALIDRSADDRTWLTVHVHDNGPIAYHSFDPVTGKSELLFVNRPDLYGYDLARLEDFCFTASDGRKLSGYAMRPCLGEAPFPTVVLVHGGPVSRDYWRFNADAQYLASLGYLSLHINYRGSKGFGGEFRLAGHGEWGGGMQQDLYDAVARGVAQGLVDPGRVAFLGASYGGYTALLAAATRPDVVRCAIAISPPCDLVSFVRRPPPFWQPLAVLLRRQVLGDLDEQALERRSPLHALGPETAPVLIAHGERDPRVPIADVDQFTAQAKALGVLVRYLRFEDEGHHVKSNANRERLYVEIEDFLEEYLAAR